MISVVIPAHNAARWLGQCLDSIPMQRHDVDAILIDDGSTDSTLRIAGRYPRLRVISTPNRGVSAARNEGIRAARGEWITFVDADDALLDGALDTLLGAAEASGADVVTALFTHDRSKITRGGERVISDGRAALSNTLYQLPEWHNSVWAKLMRTSHAREVMFVENLRYEDLEFTARLYLLPGIKVCSLKSTVYWYRPNPQSFIHQFTPSRLDALTVTAGIERIVAADSELLPAARSRRLSACFNMYLLTRRRKELKEVTRECVKEIRRLRGSALRDPRARLKNKLASLLSYLADPLL